jgi:hypothetical protein
MLDTRFPRPPGDVGHPATFPWPVRRAVVPGAWPGVIVTEAASLRASGMADAFAGVLLDLQAHGARALTTSCGFLVLLQDGLQARLRIPLISSSLLELPRLLAGEPQVGVLTIDAGVLGPDHLLAAGVPPQRIPDVIVQGVDPTGEFAQAILGNRAAMDFARAREDVVRAATVLKARCPALRSVVLECTNMPPHADAVVRATGCRVVSLRNAERLLQCFAP